MKKLLFAALLFLAASTKSSAQTDTTGTKYWYYPSQNYYYNDVSGDYWYYDEANTKWVEGRQLPGTYKVTVGDDRYPVYYKGTDVWKDNKMHSTKYKVKKNGTVKSKSKAGTP